MFGTWIEEPFSTILALVIFVGFITAVVLPIWQSDTTARIGRRAFARALALFFLVQIGFSFFLSPATADTMPPGLDILLTALTLSVFFFLIFTFTRSAVYRMQDIGWSKWRALGLFPLLAFYLLPLLFWPSKDLPPAQDQSIQTN